MQRYEDLFYTVDDGLTLYARDYPGPDSRRGCVLMMHGLTRNSRDFEVLAERLSTLIASWWPSREAVVSQNGIRNPSATPYLPMSVICLRCWKRLVSHKSPL